MPTTHEPVRIEKVCGHCGWQELVVEVPRGSYFLIDTRTRAQKVVDFLAGFLRLRSRRHLSGG